MPTSEEKFRLVFEAREAASKKIKNLNRELALLGGPKMVKSQKEIKKLEREVKLLGNTVGKASGQVKKSNGIFSRFTLGIAKGNIIANLATKAFDLLGTAISQIGKATLVAADVEELGGVLNFVGQRAGYTREELAKYKKELRASGIAQKETNQSLLRAIQGNINLTDAIKLGRIAQDAATIGQVNSSEAYQTLTDAIVKGRVVMLKSLGIQGTFQAEYKKLATTLGKTQTELTETEKLQARLNLVMKGGRIIAGAYDTAMGFASKKLRSMDRLIQDLQVSIGQFLTPSFGLLVDELSNVTKELTAVFVGDSAKGAKQMAVDIGEVAAALILATKIVFNFGQVAHNVFQIGFITPMETAWTGIKALITALSDPFNPKAWIEAGDTMSTVLDGFITDWEDIQGHIQDSDNAIKNYTRSMENLQSIMQPPERIAPQVFIPEIIEDVDFDLDLSEEFNNTVKSITDTAKVASKFILDLSKTTKNIIGTGVNSMVDSLVTGRQSMGAIFKGMAQDFMTFFIKKSLSMLITSFIPGLGSILGGIFDTPVNDRMAANQGRDFMQWFIRGALAEASGGSELAVGVTTSSNRIIPAVASGDSGNGVGGLAMQINITGNVMTDQFVEETIAPKIKNLVDDGRSLLNIQDENITGSRDVSID